MSDPPRPSVVVSPSARRRLADALEPGHDDDLAGVELGVDAARLDAGDAGLAVAAVGLDPGLGAGQRDGRRADRVEGHRDERRALVLAGGEEDVELARVGLIGDRRGQLEELVGRVAHGGHDDDELRSGGALAGDPARHAADPVGIGERGAAELLDDERRRHRLSLPAGIGTLGPRLGGPDMPGRNAKSRVPPSARSEATPSRTIGAAASSRRAHRAARDACGGSLAVSRDLAVPPRIVGPRIAADGR